MKIILIALSMATIYGVPFTPEMLTLFVATLAFVYYQIIYTLKVGLRVAFISGDGVEGNQHSTITLLVNAIAVTAVILQTPYAFVGWMAVPWIAISISTVTTSWLVYFDIIAIEEKDDDEG